MYQTMDWFGHKVYHRLSLSDYVELDLAKWLLWILAPVFVSLLLLPLLLPLLSSLLHLLLTYHDSLIGCKCIELQITFLLPAIIMLMFYCSAIIVHLFRHWHKLKPVVREVVVRRDMWAGARYAVALMWDIHGWIWHGYDVVGFENIPDDGPALLVYYHGALPVDLYYLTSKVILYKRRLIRAVGDRFLFQIPGWKLLMEAFQVFAGTVQECVAILKSGDLLSIAPGGVREAQFGDHSYGLVWNNRTGFAKVACEAQVPIIPVFTVNIREAFRTIPYGHGFFQRVYERFKIPVVPLYGGFPVKMRTIVGKPIQPDPSLSPEQVAQLTAEAIRELIREHQRVPGSVLMGILDRIYYSYQSKIIYPKRPSRSRHSAGDGSLSETKALNSLNACQQGGEATCPAGNHNHERDAVTSLASNSPGEDHPEADREESDCDDDESTQLLNRSED